MVKKIIWIKDSTTLQFVDADNNQKAKIIKEDKNNNLRKGFKFIPIVIFIICILVFIQTLFTAKQINMQDILQSEKEAESMLKKMSENV